MFALLAKFLGDPSALIAFASLLVAVFCAALAAREARAKQKQVDARARDIDLFLSTIDKIMRDHERTPELIRRITGQTRDLIETSTYETKKAIAELSGASKTLEEVFGSLRQVTNVALRSQRDSAKAHKELMTLINTASASAPPPKTAPAPGPGADA